MGMGVVPALVTPPNSAGVDLADMLAAQAAWAFDTTSVSSGFAATSGTVYGSLVHLYQPLPISSPLIPLRLYLNVTAAGIGLTNAGMALYMLTGSGAGPSLVGQAVGAVSGIADMSADFQVNSLLFGQIKPAVALTPGAYVVVHWQTGATPASLARGGSVNNSALLFTWPNWGFVSSGSQSPRFTAAAASAAPTAPAVLPILAPGPAYWAGINNK